MQDYLYSLRVITPPPGPADSRCFLLTPPPNLQTAAAIKPHKSTKPHHIIKPQHSIKPHHLLSPLLPTICSSHSTTATRLPWVITHKIHCSQRRWLEHGYTADLAWHTVIFEGAGYQTAPLYK